MLQEWTGLAIKKILCTVQQYSLIAEAADTRDSTSSARAGLR